MRIVQFLGSLCVGGAESVIKDYSIELVKRGHEVLIPIYYSTPGSPIQKEIENHNIEIDVIHKIPYSKGMSRVVNKLLTILGLHTYYLKKMLREFKPDVIHLHGYVLNDFARISKELEGVKLVYTCHNPVEEFFCGKMASQFDIAKRLIKENNMQMIALHEGMANDINAFFNIDNTIALNNPINGKRFVNEIFEKEKIKESLGIPPHSVVIGNVGRFDHQKNHSFLIDVFEKYHSQNNKSFLLLIGGENGDCFAALQEKIKDKCLESSIIFLHNRKDMPQLYSIMDCFVLTSLFEGFCLAFVEAQMVGVNCVISDVVPKAAAVSKNVIFKSLNDSIDSWVEDIVSSLESNDKNSVNANVVKLFSVENIVGKLLRIYEQKNET